MQSISSPIYISCVCAALLIVTSIQKNSDNKHLITSHFKYARFFFHWRIPRKRISRLKFQENKYGPATQASAFVHRGKNLSISSDRWSTLNLPVCPLSLSPPLIAFRYTRAEPSAIRTYDVDRG